MNNYIEAKNKTCADLYKKGVFAKLHAIASNYMDELEQALDDDMPDKFDEIMDRLYEKCPEAESILDTIQSNTAGNTFTLLLECFSNKYHVNAAYAMYLVWENERVLCDVEYEIEYVRPFDMMIIQRVICDGDDVYHCELSGYVHGEFDINNPEEKAEVLRWAEKNYCLYI